MGIRVAAPMDGHLILFYVDPQGRASLITPSPCCKNNRLAAGQWLYMIDNEGGLLEQTGRAGTESLQALVSRDPIDLNRFGNQLSVTPGGS